MKMSKGKHPCLPATYGICTGYMVGPFEPSLFKYFAVQDNVHNCKKGTKENDNDKDLEALKYP